MCKVIYIHKISVYRLEWWREQRIEIKKKGRPRKSDRMYCFNTDLVKINKSKWFGIRIDYRLVSCQTMKKEDEEAFLKEMKEKTDVKSMQKEKTLGRKMFGELEDVLS
jgi:hypothetical protein